MPEPKCPYYLRKKRRTLQCVGADLIFVKVETRDTYVRRLCCDDARWRDCPIAARLNEETVRSAD